MDREHFLESQLWLHHVSNVTMEKLRSDLNFYTVLPDAYCCFQVDKSLVFFCANQHEGDTSTSNPRQLIRTE